MQTEAFYGIISSGLGGIGGHVVPRCAQVEEGDERHVGVVADGGARMDGVLRGDKAEGYGRCHAMSNLNKVGHVVHTAHEQPEQRIHGVRATQSNTLCRFALPE